MDLEESKQYVDVVIEALLYMGYLRDSDYGRMTEDERQEMAELVLKKSEE